MSGELISAFFVWFVLAYIHVWYHKQYQGESQGFGVAINTSAVFGPLIWALALIFNASYGTWWHSLIIAVICFAVGPFASRLLTGPYRGTRSIIFALIAFAWPVSAWWAYTIIAH